MAGAVVTLRMVSAVVTNAVPTIHKIFDFVAMGDVHAVSRNAKLIPTATPMVISSSAGGPWHS
jgi:hypothetical protein